VNRAFAAIALVLALAGPAGAAQPPTKVKYTLEKGDVTFDHQAHTGRREKCKSCHGEGPARKVELDKKSAHTLCVGCHLKLRAGPKACGECHVDA
jgi:predicted CXXCH cytochrome family protein